MELVICMAQVVGSVDASPKYTIFPNLKILQIDYELTDTLKLFFSLEYPNLLILGIEVSCTVARCPNFTCH